MTIKTYTVRDGWADAQVTFSIDCEEIPLESMQETCNFWSNSEEVLETHSNDIHKAYAAYIGKFLLVELIKGRFETLILESLASEEGFLIPYNSIKILHSEVPEICSTYQLDVEEKSHA